MKSKRITASLIAAAFAAVSSGFAASAAGEDVPISFNCYLDDVSSGGARLSTRKAFFGGETRVEITNTGIASENAENMGTDEDISERYAFSVDIYYVEGIAMAKDGYLTFELPVPKSMEKKTQSVDVYLTSGENAGKIAAEVVRDSTSEAKLRFTYDVSNGNSATFMFVLPVNAQNDKYPPETAVTETAGTMGDDTTAATAEAAYEAVPFNNAETTEIASAEESPPTEAGTSAETPAKTSAETTAAATATTTTTTTTAVTTAPEIISTFKTTASTASPAPVTTTTAAPSAGSGKGSPGTAAPNTKGSPDTPPASTKYNPGTGVAIAVVIPAAAAGCVLLIKKKGGRPRGRK